MRRVCGKRPERPFPGRLPRNQKRYTERNFLLNFWAYDTFTSDDRLRLLGKNARVVLLNTYITAIRLWTMSLVMNRHLEYEELPDHEVQI